MWEFFTRNTMQTREEPLPGFEPGTYALRKHRSTAELKWLDCSSGFFIAQGLHAGGGSARRGREVSAHSGAISTLLARKCRWRCKEREFYRSFGMFMACQPRCDWVVLANASPTASRGKLRVLPNLGTSPRLREPAPSEIARGQRELWSLRRRSCEGRATTSRLKWEPRVRPQGQRLVHR